MQEEKVAEVERELNEAQHRVENAKAVYELIVRRMSEELARFQRERAAELAAVLRSFAMAQAQLAGDTANVSTCQWRVWGALPQHSLREGTQERSGFLDQNTNRPSNDTGVLS